MLQAKFNALIAGVLALVASSWLPFAHANTGSCPLCTGGGRLFKCPNGYNCGFGEVCCATGPCQYVLKLSLHVTIQRMLIAELARPFVKIVRVNAGATILLKVLPITGK